MSQKAISIIHVRDDDDLAGYGGRGASKKYLDCGKMLMVSSTGLLINGYGYERNKGFPLG